MLTKQTNFSVECDLGAGFVIAMTFTALDLTESSFQVGDI